MRKTPSIQSGTASWTSRTRIVVYGRHQQDPISTWYPFSIIWLLDLQLSMPFDGHAYLLSQGWAGKGSGLRHGAIAKPIALTQKKTLSGIGKDRDEAFPFWDQCVFSSCTLCRIGYN